MHGLRFHQYTLQVVDGQELFIEFYDDDNKDDEFLGRAKIQTSLVAMRGHIGKLIFFVIVFVFVFVFEFLGRAKIQTSLVAMRGHIGKTNISLSLYL